MAIDAQLVFYTSGNTPYIPIVNGQTLNVILKNIDTAINAHNTAPDYTGYNLYCVTQVDGVTHPTNTQNFAEGISKNLCDFHTAYNTFTGTTYPTAITTLSTAITALQTPGLTYSYTGGGGSIAITNTMSLNQVLTATYTGVGNILALLNAPGTTWSTLSITTPTNISTAFNDLIAYISNLTTTVSGKQAQIGTFNATAIGGGATDSLTTTVNELITYAAALPVFTAGSITPGGISSASTLQGYVQNTINSVNSQLTNAVVAAGTGLTIAAVGSTYQGTKLAVDPTYTLLYKSMLSTGDTYSNAGFLDAKIVGDESTIHTTITGHQIVISSLVTPTNEVKVTSSDSTPGYLYNKIPSTNDNQWGLQLSSTPSVDNSQLLLTPTLGNPNLFSENLLNYWATNPTILELFATVVAQAQSSPGTPVSNLVVSLSSTTFALAWTHQSGSAQNAKWRQTGTSEWLLNNFSTPNPLGSTVAANIFTPIPVQNQVFDFQIDTIYATGTASSNINQCIYYVQQTVTNSVTTGVISMNQSPIPVDTIQYRLLNSVPAVIQNVTTTGASPNISFTAVGSGDYTVQYRYGTLVNGGTLYSDDSTQHAAWWATGTITV